MESRDFIYAARYVSVCIFPKLLYWSWDVVVMFYQVTPLQKYICAVVHGSQDGETKQHDMNDHPCKSVANCRILAPCGGYSQWYTLQLTSPLNRTGTWGWFNRVHQCSVQCLSSPGEISIDGRGWIAHEGRRTLHAWRKKTWVLHASDIFLFLWRFFSVCMQKKLPCCHELSNL